MKRLFVVAVIGMELMALMLTGCGGSETQSDSPEGPDNGTPSASDTQPAWPEESGYLTPPRNKPATPHAVEATSGNVQIVGVSGGEYLMQGTLEIRENQMIAIYPGKSITHACLEEPTLEVSDYNGDKCVLLYGMTVRVDEYGQYVFVKYAPEELEAESNPSSE